MNAILENILSRRSVRAYQGSQVPPEDLQTILLAGSYAPNGMALQSWRFTAVVNEAARKKVNEAIRRTFLNMTVDENTSAHMAMLIEKAKDENADFLYGAPAYVIASGPRENRNSRSDCALALGTMMMAAHSLGIGSCWLNQLPGNTNAPHIRGVLTELGVPEEHDAFGSIALGYAAGEPKPADARKDVIHIID
ncbi:MAG: nitroreductase family protein [Bacillota bacterium]